MLIFRTYSIIFIAVLVSFMGYSQKNIDHQRLLWTRYQLKLKIDEHWSVSQELDERMYWFPWRQHQFVSRTSAQYQLGKGWNVGTGLAYFLQALPQDAHKNVSNTQTEVRPQFELGYKQQLSRKFNLHHRYWTEFRYFKIEKEDLQFGNYRMRYKFELQYLPTDKITLKVYDEIFINLGKNIIYNTFDQNRIGTSIQYMPLKNLGFELGYINLFQQRPTGVDFYERNIVRFTIHHNIYIKKSKT